MNAFLVVKRRTVCSAVQILADILAGQDAAMDDLADEQTKRF
jgi:hypothetical protein